MFHGFFAHVRKMTLGPHHSKVLSAVIDSSNKTLVALGPSTYVMSQIYESFLDTTCIPELPIDMFREVSRKPYTYPEWTVDIHELKLNRTNPQIITDEMRRRSEFAAIKAASFAEAIYWINRYRTKVPLGFIHQDVIYTEKARQARQLKEAGYSVELRESCAYVAAHADATGTSLKTAADDILLQWQFYHEQLGKTETVRTSLMNKIKRAKTPRELKEIMVKLSQFATI